MTYCTVNDDVSKESVKYSAELQVFTLHCLLLSYSVKLQYNNMAFNAGFPVATLLLVAIIFSTLDAAPPLGKCMQNPKSKKFLYSCLLLHCCR